MRRNYGLIAQPFIELIEISRQLITLWGTRLVNNKLIEIRQRIVCLKIRRIYFLLAYLLDFFCFLNDHMCLIPFLLIEWWVLKVVF